MEKKKYLIEEIIIGVAILVMFVIILANVFSRFVLNMSIAFSEELVTYLFIYASIFGASSACAHGANMGMDALVNLFPKKLRVIMIWFSAAMSITLFAVLAWQGMDVIMSQMRYGNKTPQMQLPVWIFTLSIPSGSALYIFRVVKNGIKETKKLLGEAV